MKVLKIILYTIFAAAFATSLYFSYLYIKQNKISTTLPPEMAERMSAERLSFLGSIKSVDKDKITVSLYSNQPNIEDSGDKEVKTDTETRYIITPFGKNEHNNAKIDDVKEGESVSVVAIKNSDGTLTAETIDIVAPAN